MKKNIIGRKADIQRFEKYTKSNRSEFIAVYGRRRIGKTYLIRELFEGRFTFRMTGKENVTTKEQLENFNYALNNFTTQNTIPENWEQAFQQLISYIESEVADKQKIIFFDELPWLDTRGSKFVSALEHFWNDWASYRTDIKLIVCGSATTWMLNKVINARGGLHNRATHTMLLQPFSLNETEEYFHFFNFPYERQELIECYMAMGGVPYYFSLFEQDKSVAQNLESLCFTRGGELIDEFKKVFRSLFQKSENHIAVITALQKRCAGMTRQEIMNEAKQTNNGNLTKLLHELEECSFIRSYVPFGKSKKDKLFQIIDPFILFYFRFMSDGSNFLKGYWQKIQTTSTYATWCGYAFEIVCLNHIEQIVRALGIDGTINTACSWTYRPQKTTIENADADSDLKQGAQIDLLIDRSDKTITICEMKYSQGEYEITKTDDTLMNQRIRTFRKVTKTKKTVVPTFITPNGLLDNIYSRRLTRNVVGNDLFV